jgi:hypothetical protein
MHVWDMGVGKKAGESNVTYRKLLKKQINRLIFITSIHSLYKGVHCGLSTDVNTGY